MSGILAFMLGALVVNLVNSIGPGQGGRSDWTSYKLQHSKVYDRPSLDAFRRSIYERNKELVDRFHNEHRDARMFQLELNHLADYTDFERAQINGFRPRPESIDLGSGLRAVDGTIVDDDKPRNSPEEQAFLDKILADKSIEVPDSLDWRKTPGRVSDVKNQGMCGSCWAFASTGTLEGQEQVHKSLLRNNTANSDGKALTLLSEQNLVDCVTDDYGCNGGLMEDALRFVKKEGGIDDESSYPYEARTGKCRFNKAKVAFGDTGAAILPAGDEQKLKEVVAKFGPVSVAIDASSLWFQLYHKGVYVNKRCKNKENQLDHGVLVVGYGTDPKKGDYWIVKNSWGPHWGESGYIRMARNRKNMCGIATVATIPTF